MTVPPGFKVTLFAGEPDVVQPIAMAIDDRGRLWIAEAYSYPRRVPQSTGARSHPHFRRHRRRRPLRFSQGLRRSPEPGQRPGGRLRRSLGRRGPGILFHSRPRTATTAPTARPRSCSTAGASTTPTRPSTASSGAPTAGSTAATASSPTRGSASPALQTPSASRSTRASGATIPSGTSSRFSHTARATPGASTSTPAARCSSPPASFPISIT